MKISRTRQKGAGRFYRSNPFETSSGGRRKSSRFHEILKGQNPSLETARLAISQRVIPSAAGYIIGVRLPTADSNNVGRQPAIGEIRVRANRPVEERKKTETEDATRLRDLRGR